MEGNEEPDREEVRTQDFSSLRLTFSFTETSVTLRMTEPVKIIAPPGPRRWPSRGQPGAWVDLRDPDDVVLFVRLMHDPFDQIAEHHTPEGPELAVRPRGSGEFDVLVPDLPDVTGGKVFASDPAGPRSISDVVGEFSLDKRGEAA